MSPDQSIPGGDDRDSDSFKDRLALLRSLFPECVSEGQVDFDKFRRLFGDLPTEGIERYALDWAGKREAIRILQVPSVSTLTPDRGE